MITAEQATLTLAPIVANLEQLRGLERLVGRAGACRVLRFDEVFESLDALIVAHPLPLGHLTIEGHGVKVRIALDGVFVMHDGEATDLIRDIELYLRELAVPPVLRWLNPFRVMLAVALFVAAYEGAYATMLISLVVLVLLEHTAFEARARSAALKLREDWTLDPRLSVAIVGLVIVVAKLLQRFG
jgi:hypothetical protein